MDRPQMGFDLAGFVAKVSKKGAKQATIGLVTDLLLLTHKAMTSRARPEGRKGS